MVTLTGISWNHTRGLPPVQAASSEFSREFPEVRIDWQARSLHEFGHTPVDQLAARYDLIVLDHPWVGFMAETGWFLPMDEWIAADDLRDLEENSVGPSHRSYAWEGHQWGLAIDAATPSASYRPDLLFELESEIPSDWAGVLELAARCRSSGKWIAMPFGPVDAITAFLSLAANFGQQPFELDGQVVEKDVGERVLETLQEILNACPPRTFELTPITLMEWMSTTDDLVYCPLAYSYSNYSRAGYRPHLCLYADLPSFEENGPRGSHIGGTGIGVSSRCQHPEAAAAFALRVANGPWQRSLYFEAGGQPAHAAAWDDDAVNKASNNFFRNTRRTIEQAFLRPRYNGYIDFQYRAGEMIVECLRERTGHAALLQDLNRLYRGSLPR
ncbi:ABC transporter substrate-binding protein [Planctomicrobium sp. SH661]|uniref:ABC transporter substrate-binding protein n=1 Tax=Planctomicrobium sp. SH661 TaxID=3448124 RepID=UPI003F5BDE28